MGIVSFLKWALLAIAIVTFARLGWMTALTYKASPPLPSRFVSTDGTLVMSAANIEAGKAGFQKAGLMDYGSLYGMGSYSGEDYTASNLVRLAQLTQANIA
jgi:nitric oxide reductase subunit B